MEANTTRVWCRANCAGLCALTRWRWVLDDTLPSPAAWRFAWSLVGLPEPLDPAEWPDMFAAFEDTFGVGELIRGLRLAADQPTMSGGWDADRRGRVVHLLDYYGRAVAVES